MSSRAWRGIYRPPDFHDVQDDLLRRVRGVFCKGLLSLGICFLFVSGLWGQTDTSLVPTPKDTFNTRVPSEIYSNQFDTVAPISPLFLPKDTVPLTLKLRVNNTWAKIKEQKPEIYEEEDKMKLRLHFPWRDDIVLPFPRGLLPAPKPPPFDPKIAWQRALMMPTLGQIYNRRYWKVPIFLAGYGGAIWFVNYNNQQYRIYGDAFLCKVDEDNGCDPGPQFAGLDSEGIRNRRNKFRQNRDYAILGVIGWHLISVAEAFVDGHMRGFDVSDDLSYRTYELKPSFEPIMMGNSLAGPAVGVKLTF